MIRRAFTQLFVWYGVYSVIGVGLAASILMALTELNPDLIFDPVPLTQFFAVFVGLMAAHILTARQWTKPVLDYENDEDAQSHDLTPEQARKFIECLNRMVIHSTIWVICVWPLGGMMSAAIYGFREEFVVGWIEKTMIVFVATAVGVMISIYQRALAEAKLEPAFQYFRIKGGLPLDDAVFRPRIRQMRWLIGWPVAWLLVILCGFGILFGFAQGEKTVRFTMERLAVYRLAAWHQQLEAAGEDPAGVDEIVQIMDTQMAVFKPSPNGAALWLDRNGSLVGESQSLERQLAQTPLTETELRWIADAGLTRKDTLRTAEIDVMDALQADSTTRQDVSYRRMLSRKLDLWVWIPLTGGGAVAMVFPRRDIQQDLTTVFLVAALFLTTGVLLWRIAVFSAEGITQPLMRLLSSLAGIAEGDLSKPVNVAAYNEVGRVSRAVQLMRDGLRSLVGRISQSSAQLGEISSRVSRSSGEVHHSTEAQVKAVDVASVSIEQIGRSLNEVSRTVGGLSEEARTAIDEVREVSQGSAAVEKSVDSLSARIEETNSSIFEVAASIRSVVDNIDTLSMTANDTASSIREMEQSIVSVRDLANDSVDTASRVLHDAELGARAVQENLQTMEAIRDTSLQATTTMQQLSQSLSEIREIVQVIQDVATKTNLLSLNAAIIAAQAGEEGAGFSVVAGQIKQLAGRTQRSARDIGERIQAILKEAASAVQLVLEGDQQIEHGVTVSAEVRAALEQIQYSTVEITERVKRIAQATGEQSQSAADITRSISRTVEMVDSIARATDEQKRGADQITKASEAMQATANEVRGTVLEQKRLTERISERIQRIAGLVESIDRAAREQGAGAKEISWAATSISESSRNNLDRVLELNEAIRLLAAEAQTLSTTVQNFKV
ncbi:MAG: methyl-accepting chemotaxis protein [Deltaproteobacteria bacterium]|nr:methyl-accepting chemotaxis protein [Deltaproteobacteria bacterium]